MAEIAHSMTQTKDGTNIAYDVVGDGPPLILLHGGFIQTRQAWHDVGYVEQFSKAYTAIPIDLRGHGQSDSPTDPAFYTVDKIVDDVLAVAEAEGLAQFALLGFSLGAIIALQVAANSNRVGCAIVVGGGFGRLYTKETTEEQIKWTETVIEAVEAGRVDELGLNPKWRDRILASNLYTRLAWTQALFDWPTLKPQDIGCSTLMVAGSANEIAVENLETYRQDMEAVGMQSIILDGLDHSQEFREIDSVLPVHLKFLREYLI